MGRVGKPLCQHGGIGNENFWFESKEKGSGRRKNGVESIMESSIINGPWGISSAGRAPRSQRGGQRFDPAMLHQDASYCRTKTTFQ